MHTCDLAFTNCFVFFYQSMQITTNLQLEVKVFHKFLKYRFHGVPMKNSPNADRIGWGKLTRVSSSPWRSMLR